MSRIPVEPRQATLPFEEQGTASPDQSQKVRPFIKWAGGKARLREKILPFAPHSFSTYHEPFLGGGSMFFALRSRAQSGCYLSDLNEELVHAWKVMRDRPLDLLAGLESYRVRDSRDFYYEQRSATCSDPVDRAARFLYLNQTSWNGLWRVNKYGQFNVPWGDRAFRGFEEEYLHRVSQALKACRIDARDFRDALKDAAPGDFVYLDPPYLPISDTSKFYLYTEKRFRAPDLEELSTWCVELSRKRVSWMLSNRDTPLVRKLFKPFRLIAFTAKRSVAAQNARDVESRESPEVLIVGDKVR